MRNKHFAVSVLLFSGIWAFSLLAAGPAAVVVQDEHPSLDVPYVPTTPELVEQMLRLGQIKASDTLYDLGCGDGRIVVMAARKFGAHGVGVDLNPERIREANENARKAGVADKVKFVNANLFDADIHNATIVTLYLLPDVNLKLRPKLLKDLRPGTRIVSHSFDMGDWKPDKEIEVNGSRLMLWTVPKAK